jgi:hypothetical protein
MTAEGDVLKKMMMEHLAKAKAGGCTADGHAALVEYLEISATIHQATLSDMKADVKAIRLLAEKRGSIFGAVPWARPAKVTGVTGLAASVVWALAKLYGLVP